MPITKLYLDGSALAGQILVAQGLAGGNHETVEVEFGPVHIWGSFNWPLLGFLFGALVVVGSLLLLFLLRRRKIPPTRG